ncbi:alpha/beta fold hydrolase [Mycobacterium parmense]|uniref:Haloalkane dehalogenase 2 n=1 Tax=Mycobacterium parmense TaxID=185642 RepID=A0A7I7YRE5_9MYCO|nr:alpha/beta fold hydrolase [Mycobacterium parmense]MCV7349628.1 alpha/beta fold hydrolase [Mycobacterium parmense]ORW58910.1 haloalkane dehalogenase [Mycobacterium parmense]BBZ43732.1 haloalkane dehalogenase 2 [Mycobacterium parmense]
MHEFTVDRSLYPFESRWFDGRYGRMHYIDEGHGTPIIFFHGNPTWSFLYRNIITRLRGEFRCIAVDYLGFGLSEHPSDFGYTVEEHVAAVGEWLDHLNLDGFITMGQDWGGPVSMAIATERHATVRGVVLGNTWFWPSDGWRLKLFSIVMSSWPMQYLVLHRNLFVEFLPFAVSQKPTDAVMQHYRDVQPSPAARRGIAEFPREIRAARPLLERLARDVPSRLGSKSALFVWGMKDPAFGLAAVLSRLQGAFPDNVLIRLPQANHFIQEDAPDAIAEAIIQRFGGADDEGEKDR